MEWWFAIIIGIACALYYLEKYKKENKDISENNGQNPQGDNSTINLGNYNHYLEPDEICLFQQEDVAWYGYTSNYRDQMYLKTSMDMGNVRLSSISEISDGEPDDIWNVRAAGTLYLTNKRVIVYDKGFSNVWTKLSIEGDYPEQAYGFLLEDITDVKQMELTNVGLKGILVSTTRGPCILAPSHRKYNGRRTSIMNEYPSLAEFGARLITIKDAPEIDRLQKKIDDIKKERCEMEKS
ncbi:hypothetical protein [Metabacillus litoralis]|uniref:hypothetical protein n=1 Tax=Metabacillus litoralis TaxID=152268 RepID=UPI002040DA94|nr:hypothetical protein [Metabacillus litoralis]MCM3654108.1 hypothetical protein [Metabacillus litoralis]